MPLRGIRGAIDVPRNTRDSILERTQQLLRAALAANGVRPDDIAAAFFTMTPDLDADFPAHAARRLGWNHVPLMCAAEIAVPGAMKRVVRVLLLVNSDAPPDAIRHPYLGATPCLRPDLAKPRAKGTPRKSSPPNSASTKTFEGGRR